MIVKNIILFLLLVWFLVTLFATVAIIVGHLIFGGYKVQLVASGIGVSIAAIWDADDQRLYWVGLKNMGLYCYDPASGKPPIGVQIKDTPHSPLSTVLRVLGTSDVFFLGINESLQTTTWDCSSIDPVVPSTIFDTVDPRNNSRITSANTDPDSHITALATRGDRENIGKIYFFDQTKNMKYLHLDVQLVTSMLWSLDGKHLYVLDSMAHKVYQYDYFKDYASVSNQKVVFSITPREPYKMIDSLFDGMTIDSDGMLWIAVYGHSQVIRINPNTGASLMTIVLPQPYEPTSVVFGDKNLKTLYVTTIKANWKAELETEYTQPGNLYKITGLGVKGTPSRRVKDQSSKSSD